MKITIPDQSYFGSNEQRQDILDVTNNDRDCLSAKEAIYKGSWAKRGGIGAFMMLARKWDRIEEFAKDAKYDVFKAYEEADGHHEGIHEDVADLRRYLLLVEALFIANKRINNYNASSTNVEDDSISKRAQVKREKEEMVSSNDNVQPKITGFHIP